MATPQKSTGTTRSAKLPPKKKAKTVSAVNPDAEKDPAHSPGHRKLNVKGEFKGSTGEKIKTQSSALNRNTKADQINRDTAQIRMSGFVNSAGSRRRKGSKSAH